MARSTRYSPEVRERAVRMVFEHESEYASQWQATISIASKFGCTAETLRRWVRRAEIDSGRRDGVTSEAGDTGLSAWILIRVVVGFVETAGEQGDRIMAGCAQAGRAHVAVAFQQHAACILDAETVGGVVEGAQGMHASPVLPGDVSMALGADLVSHQVGRRDASVGGDLGQGGCKGAFHAYFVPCIHEVQDESRGHQSDCGRRPAHAPVPLEPRAGKAVQYEQPGHGERRDDMHPVGQVANLRIVDLEKAESGEQDAGEEQGDQAEIKADACADRIAVRAPPGTSQVQGAEQQRWDRQEQAESEMAQEQTEIETILICLPGDGLSQGYAGQIQRVNCHEPEEREIVCEQSAQARCQDGYERAAGGSHGLLGNNT